jgi:hypothetical protein
MRSLKHKHLKYIQQTFSFFINEKPRKSHLSMCFTINDTFTQKQRNFPRFSCSICATSTFFLYLIFLARTRIKSGKIEGKLDSRNVIALLTLLLVLTAQIISPLSLVTTYDTNNPTLGISVLSKCYTEVDA